MLIPRCRTRTLLLGSAFLFLGAPDSHAINETNREVARSYANFYVQRRELPAADAFLQDHLQSDGADAGAWNLLGLVRQKASDNRGAIAAFQKAVLNGKGIDRAIYGYNLAAATLAAGNKEGAIRELQAAATAEERVRPSAEAAIESVKAGRDIPPLELVQPGRFSTLLRVSGGYDTNVLLLSNSAVLEADQPTAASPTTVVGAELGYLKIYHGGNSLGWQLGTSFLYNTSAEAHEFNALQSSLSSAFQWGWSKLSVLGSGSFLNTEGLRFYHASAGAGYELSIPWTKGMRTRIELPVQYQRYAPSEDSSANRSGSGFSINLSQEFLAGSLALVPGLSYEFHQAVSEAYRTRSYSIPVALSAPLFWRIRLTTAAEYELADFPQSSSQGSGDRLDRIYQASATLSRGFFSSRLELSLAYQAQYSFSTLSTATYRRHTAAIEASYALF